LASIKRIDSTMPHVLTNTSNGIYCEAGDFYIDPKCGVKRAVVTHGHSDHARSGSEAYLCSESSKKILQIRLGKSASIESMGFGEQKKIGEATVSFHPAGHILGSAQVRVEVGGEIWVASGDYNPAEETSCESFASVPCHTFITECTFGFPIYRWKSQTEVFGEVNQWWSDNAKDGEITLMHAYSLGKAQRILSGLDSEIGPIFGHSAVLPFLPIYEEQRVPIPKVKELKPDLPRQELKRAMVIVPPAVQDMHLPNNVRHAKTGMVSGWMTTRGARKQSRLNRGFALSDHADWKGILTAVKACGAGKIYATHGNVEVLVRYLREIGYDCQSWDDLREENG
jgi:putative mRNA 3-end processing factor